MLGHLGQLFGSEAADPAAYFERNWSVNAYTNDEVVWFGDSAGYGHPPFEGPCLGDRLVWAGSETSSVGGGHMGVPSAPVSWPPG